jgi:hypothetical protein
MAESSRFWATNGTGDGINTGFTVTHWQNLLLKMFEGGEEASGAVLRGVGSALLPTGVATPITIPPGAAIGYGYFYENDANVTHAVTSPVVGTTGGHIVLETNWAAQTVRTKMYKNTDGIATPPALTQTAGTLWQTRLCTFTITTGGVIAITDARNLAHYSTEIITSMIRDQAITTAKIADLAVTNAKLAVGAALANLGYTPWHSGNDGSGSGLDADTTDGQHAADMLYLPNHTGQINAAQMLADIVDDTKLGNRVAQFIRRQGGDANNMSVAGTTTYTPGAIRVQWGSVNLGALGAGSGGGGSIVFPLAYSQIPIVLTCGMQYKIIFQQSRASGGAAMPSTTGFDYEYSNEGGGVINPARGVWLAIGTE